MGQGAEPVGFAVGVVARVLPRLPNGHFLASEEWREWWSQQPKGLCDWMTRFLAELEDSGGNVSLSAELAGVTNQNAWKARARNPEFRSAWNLTEAKIARLRIPRRTRPRMP